MRQYKNQIKKSILLFDYFSKAKRLIALFVHKLLKALFETRSLSLEAYFPIKSFIFNLLASK